MSRRIFVPLLGEYRVVPGMNAEPDTTYFAQCGEYIKVGCSSNVKKRLRNLSSPSGRAHMICPDDLPAERMQLLGTLPGGWRGETTGLDALSQVDDEAHVCGEWFRATPAVLAWIAEQTEAEAA